MTDATVLLRELERLRAVVLTRIADVDRRDLHTLADAPSTGTWIAAQQTSLTRTEVALARRLAAFPAVSAAVDDGSLSVAVAARVAAALVKARPHVDRPDGLIDGQPAEPTIRAVVVDGVRSLVCQARGGLADDDPLLRSLHEALEAIAASSRSELDRLTDAFVLLARHVEPGDLPSALAQLLDALLPNELERRAHDAHEQRGFRMRLKEDGSGWLITRGDLDLECGELLSTVLAAELAVDQDGPADTAAYAQARHDGWQPGDDLPDEGCGGPRSLDQQRHDALRNGLRRYLDSGIAGLRDKVAPHLAVTVPIEALHDEPGALPPVAASGARLPRSLVRRWWCDSAVTRFVLSLGHRVLETSHTERTLKPHERRAKRIETGGRCQGVRLLPRTRRPTRPAPRRPLGEVRHHEPVRQRPVLRADARPAPPRPDDPAQGRPTTRAARLDPERHRMTARSGRRVAPLALLHDQLVEVLEPAEAHERLAHAPVALQPLGVALEERPVPGGVGARLRADAHLRVVRAAAAVVAHAVDVRAAGRRTAWSS